MYQKGASQKLSVCQASSLAGYLSFFEAASIACAKRTRQNKAMPEKITSFVVLIATMLFFGMIAVVLGVLASLFFAPRIIPVNHQIAACIDLPKHPADDIPLALLVFIPYNCPGFP